ncbi:sensor histidine kinase [Conexibacter arvalis]|uniref:histidine kinase n=1 Tax=Conexibacter arvalis TaxID=912552 RepID=A0A840I8I7_9ACTN|nr:sensor histidine kinase [Conexibacter arvalis]MBB4660563.1 signal transduction histidine kinase [Conexibacter arvalis]
MPTGGLPRERDGAGRRSAAPAGAVKLVVAELAGVGVLLGIIEIALGATAVHDPWWTIVLWPAAAWIYLLAGIAAWRRRPYNRIGPLLIAAGFVLLASGLVGDEPAIEAIALIVATLPYALVVHLLHAFPSGRLQGRLSVLTVAAGYAVCLLLQVPQYLFGPETALQVADRPDLADAALRLQWTAGSAVMVVTAVILARRVRDADPSERRALGGLYLYGILAVLLVPLSSQVARAWTDEVSVWLGVAQLGIVAGVAVAFLAAMVRGGFARSARIEELAAWLAGDMRAGELRDVLAEALGDPTVELLYWAPDRGRHLDVDGRPVALPDAPTRAVVDVSHGDRKVGAIVHDRALAGDEGLVRAAGRAVALAFDNERLMADLRASREALRASRARIVAAADDERRRIARDLHDGLQARLLLLAVHANGVRTDAQASAQVRARARELEAGLDEAITELRELAQGVVPAALTERGLAAALEDLLDRVPIPSRLEVGGVTRTALRGAAESTAYFVVSEAVANAVKHAGARELDVAVRLSDGWLRVEVRDDGAGGARLGDGAGLRSMADRVEALGGEVAIASEPGGGTCVAARIPALARHGVDLLDRATGPADR